MEGVILREDDDYVGTEELPASVAGASDAASAGSKAGDSKLSLNAAVVRIGQRTGVNADTLRGGGEAGRNRRGRTSGDEHDGRGEDQAARSGEL